MIQDLLDEGDRRMNKAVDVLVQDLTSVRTGRASTALIDSVPVEYYGTPTPLNQIASITVVDARSLLITPYDRSAMPEIDKAIRKADLGLNPSSDGTAMRIIVPSLTEDRRRDMVKVVHKKLEEHKVAVRNVRREVQDKLKAMEKEKTASTDEVRRASERLQKITDHAIAEMDTLGSAKESEVMAV
ncbi:MAG: ribosome recycling factor [Chloroflexi bacterium]|nr:ribosome recycling factor [Chloroflexota bacterium]